MQVYKDFDLTPILWYKIGGMVPYVLECQSREDILEALDFIKQNNIERIFVIGLGANLLFKGTFFEGAVIRIVNNAKPDIKIEGEKLTAFAGETLNTVILSSLSNSLTGLEWAGGLPGTVGASVRGNAGAFGGEIKDSITEAEIIDLSSRQIHKLSNHDLKFSYRSSIIKENRNLIVTSATFKLKKASDLEIQNAKGIYHANIVYREKNHPLEYPNCGSVFKNIKESGQVGKIIDVWPDIKDKVSGDWHGKVSMGYCIKRLGLSNMTVGRAQISEKHANFIVNLGGAQFGDVYRIINAIKEKFNDTFGFEPECEVEIVQ